MQHLGGPDQSTRPMRSAVRGEENLVDRRLRTLRHVPAIFHV